MTAAGPKSWYTAADLAALALPGLPKVKRKINELAAEKRWAFQVDRSGEALARPRAGRGGGLEYHVSLLPPAAIAELGRRGMLAPDQAPQTEAKVASIGADQLWSWFERQADSVRAEARRRLKAVDDIEALEGAGHSRTAAVAHVAASCGVSAATLWNWLGLITGCAPMHRLPRLAPRRQGGGVEAAIDDRVWLMFKSDYLRPERPTLASCHARVLAYAASIGAAVPHVKTLQRRLEREVDGRVILSRRSGAEAVRRILPPQTRSIADLGALELVNIDGHKWDVFVRFPAGRIARPMMVAIQDVYSRKILAWRIGETESAVQTRLAFADLFRNFGIPDGCLLDNGRAFASKWITGGAPTRFRFTIRPEDPTGLLTSLGVKIHWATPYRGQSKPIERGFRDLCDHGAKHPAFAGAYTGNRPDAKPENYGEKAVDLDVFTRIAGAVIKAHNARIGRRTEAAAGRSFDAAFDESYARRPITRATAEQLRLALLAAEKISTDRNSGAIAFHGNRYWTDALSAIAGERVVVRFDPDDLAADIHVYGLDGRFVASAPAIDATGFLDIASAKARAKLEADVRKKTRELVELEALLTADQIAELLPDDEPDDAAASPKVVRPARVRGAVAARAPLIDRLDFEEIVPAREERPPLRLVE